MYKHISNILEWFIKQKAYFSKAIHVLTENGVEN